MWQVHMVWSHVGNLWQDEKCHAGPKIPSGHPTRPRAPLSKAWRPKSGLQGLPRLPSVRPSRSASNNRPALCPTG